MSEKLIDAIVALRALKRGWDGYDGLPPSECTIQKAMEFAEHLDPDLPWAAVPGSDGSIQLEAHSNGYSIEIDITEDSGESLESRKIGISIQGD